MLMCCDTQAVSHHAVIDGRNSPRSETDMSFFNSPRSQSSSYKRRRPALYFNYKVLIKLLNYYTGFTSPFFFSSHPLRNIFSPSLRKISPPLRKIFSPPSAFFFPTFSSSIAAPTSCSFNPHVPHLSLDLNRCVSSISYNRGGRGVVKKSEIGNWYTLKSISSIDFRLHLSAIGFFGFQISILGELKNSIDMPSNPPSDKDERFEDAEYRKVTIGICLRLGIGLYHDFFPENQGDVILVEVQEEKRSIQGGAIIPVSSLHDNPISLL
ncbi:hypothetical protein LXL04_000933 [Taraxacum kok-saghyz]